MALRNKTALYDMGMPIARVSQCKKADEDTV